MDKILITIMITTGVMFVGLFAMWGCFAAPSLYLAMNIGIFSLVASVPLSIFLVMNNSFWGSVSKSRESSHHPVSVESQYNPQKQKADPLSHAKPYLIGKPLAQSPPTLGKNKHRPSHHKYRF